MSSETDLIKLYSQRILALAADIPRHHTLPDPDITVSRRAPLCGSTVQIEIKTDKDRITDYGQNVKACALGQAAASVVGGAIVGATSKQVSQARDELKAMLSGDDIIPAAPFDGLEVLMPAKDYKNRHASILLTLEASVEALEKLDIA